MRARTRVRRRSRPSRIRPRRAIRAAPPFGAAYGITNNVAAVPDISLLDATAQAELIARRDLSAAELVDAAIARIESLNPQLNAVIHERFDRARAEAGTARG